MTTKDIHNFLNTITFEDVNPKKYTNLKPETTTSYENGRKNHNVKVFRVGLENQSGTQVDVRWGFCLECNKIRFHEVIAYDENTGTAYEKKFYDKGEVVTYEN